MRKNSRLYFSCRTDRQVKIRGERIELDEVDYRLREAGFNDAYTILVEGDMHSFVESGDDVDEKIIRTLLAKQLSFHSLPKTIRSVTNLPRNPNGKIDRAALEHQATS